jgi:hypothetical protein
VDRAQCGLWQKTWWGMLVMDRSYLCHPPIHCSIHAVFTVAPIAGLATRKSNASHSILCHIHSHATLHKLLYLLPKPLTPTPYPMHAVRSRRTPKMKTKKVSMRVGLVLAQKFLVDRHAVDALLGKLKCGEENSVDDTRSRHGHAEAWTS